MAAESDGSLIIDTELDREGFEKGTEKLLGSIKELTQAVDILGDNMMRSFGQVTPMLQAVANAATAINGKIGEGATQTAAANEQIAGSEERVAEATQQAASAVQQQAAAVNNTRTSVSSLEKEINSLSTGLQSVSRSAESGFANGKAVLSFDDKLTDLEDRLAEARTRLEDFGNTQIPTDDFREITAQVEKSEQALFRLYERRDTYAALGVKENSQQWQRLALDIQNAEAVLARYESARDSLAENGGAFISGEETEAFARMQSALDKAETVLNRNKALIDQESLAQARMNVLTEQEAVAAASTTEERQAALQRLQEAQAQLNDIASSMSNNPAADPPAPDEEDISLWQRFGAAIKTAGAYSVKIAGTLAQISFQGMVRGVQAAAKGVQALGNRLKNYVKQAKGAKLQSNALVKSLTSLKRMLITRIKRMFISSIFNSAKEGLQTLARFSDTFNSAMSNIKNTSKELSGNLSVTLGGLIKSFEPMITGIAEAMSKAISYFNAFFAMLSGKSTMTVAKKQTDSYRDSLDGAAKSAEDLKNQVYGFDELNKRSDKDEDEKKDGSDLFEEVAIDEYLPDKIKELLEELKELWEDGDYFNFGAKIGDGLSSLLQTVDDWINGTFRPKGEEWAKNIAQILNGLLGGYKWDQLGKTLADGLNSVFGIFNTFLKEFDFEKLGRSVGDAINGLFKNIEWDQLGETLANKWNALIGFLYGLVDEIEWDTMGDSLAEGFTSFINTVDWDTAAKTITTSINGIVEAFQHFIDGVDWNDLGSKLGGFINDLFEGVDWAAAGKLLGDSVKALLQVIATTLEETDWQAIGHDVAEYIRNIDWNGVTSAFFEGLGAALGALAAFLWGLIEDAWNSVVEWWYENAYEDGQFTISGLLKGIGDALSDIWNWIKQHIFEPFITGFKKAFGIASPSTVMAEMGGYIVQGLLQGITNAWGAITQFFTKAVEAIKTALSTAWNAIKDAASTAWNNIKTAVTEKFDAAKQAIASAAEAIKTGLSTAWEDIKEKSSSAWESIKSTVKEKFDAAKQAVSETVNTIKSDLQTAWDNVKEKAASAWDSLKSTVSQRFNDLKTDLTSTADGIKSDLSGAWNELQNTASTAWNNLSNTVIGLWTGLKDVLTNTDWQSVGSNVVSGIQNGITSAWTWLTTTVDSLTSGLVSGVKSFLGIHSPSTVFAEIGKYLDLGLVEGIEKNEKNVLSTVSDMAQDVTDQFDSEKATLQIGAEGDGMVTKLAGIAAKLSDIAGVFRDINSMLTDMGGLRVPAIATGTEVPYKTRISSDTDNGNNRSIDLISGLLDERLADFAYLLRQILDLLERKKLGTDNDELAAAIALALNRMQRGYGGV